MARGPIFLTTLSEALRPLLSVSLRALSKGLMAGAPALPNGLAAALPTVRSFLKRGYQPLDRPRPAESVLGPSTDPAQRLDGGLSHSGVLHSAAF